MSTGCHRADPAAAAWRRRRHRGGPTAVRQREHTQKRHIVFLIFIGAAVRASVHIVTPQSGRRPRHHHRRRHHSSRRRRRKRLGGIGDRRTRQTSDVCLCASGDSPGPAIHRAGRRTAHDDVIIIGGALTCRRRGCRPQCRGRRWDRRTAICTRRRDGAAQVAVRDIVTL